jgi:muramoyltetrapeptide carboxypeptidase
MHPNMVAYANNSPEDARIITYRSGSSSGQLFGGNLTVLSSLVGSDYLPDWEGKLLFLEDVNEEPYRVDRMLTQFELAGILSKVSGVILGGFRKCEPEDPLNSFSLQEVFEQHFSERNYPVFFGAQIGHIMNKFTVPVGVEAKMDADAGTILLQHPAVR